MLGKAGKAVSLSTAYLAQLQAKKQRLKYQLEQLQSKRTRNRVRVDQNERFSNVESIKAAVDSTASQAAQSSTKETEKAAAYTLASMCT